MTTANENQTTNNEATSEDQPMNWSDAVKNAATDKQANIMDVFAAGWDGMVTGLSEEVGPKIASLGEEAVEGIIKNDGHFKTGIAILDWGGKIAAAAPDLAKGGYDARSALVGIGADLALSGSVGDVIALALFGTVGIEGVAAVAVGVGASFLVAKAWEAFSKTDMGHAFVDQLTDPATWAQDAKDYEAFGLAMGSAMCDGLEAVQDAITKGASSVDDYLDAFGNQFVNSLSSVNLAMQKIADGVKEDHQPLLDAIDSASNYVSDAIAAAKDKAAQTGEGLAQTMGDMANSAMDISLPKDLINTIIDSAGGAASYVGQAVNDMKQFTMNYFDPLIVDLNGSGFDVKSLGSDSPYFDLNQDGVASKNSWVGAGTGFLTQDLDGDGRIKDGSELLTSFDALKAYDTNNDSAISAGDTNFSKLGVWQDANQNGVVDDGELKSLSDLGVQSISLATQNSQATVGDSHLTQTATITMTDGTTRSIGAIDLQTSAVYTKDADGVNISPDVTSLPYLIGYGRMPDLWSAMTNNADLKTEVQNLMTIDPTNGVAFDAALRDVMFKWAGLSGDAGIVSYVDATGKTVQVYPEVGFLREYLASDTMYRGEVSNPILESDIAATSDAWTAVFNGIKARILTSMPGTAFAAAFGVDTKTDHVLPRQDLATSMSILAQRQPADPAKNVAYWVDAIGIIQNYLLDDKVPWNTVEATLRQFMPSWISDKIVHQLASANLDIAEASNISFIGSVIGTNFADLWVTTKPNSTIYAGNGVNEEFVVLPGMGNTTISCDNRTGAYTNVLYIAKDIDPSLMTVTATETGSIVLSIGDGETVTLGSMASTGGTRYGVQQVVFANGTTMSAADLMAREIASGQAGHADQIWGTTDNDRLDALGGNTSVEFPSNTDADVVTGNGGNDTFVYRDGYGFLEVNQVNSLATRNSVLELDGSIDPSQVRLSTDSDGNVWINFGSSVTDLVKIDGMTKTAANGVQSIVFGSTGETWTLADILARINSAPGGIYNFLDNQAFDTGGQASFVASSGVNNVFAYKSGYGALEINQKVTSGLRSGVLALGAGIDPSQVTVSADGSGNIYLTIGDSGYDVIKLDGMWNNQASGVSSVTFANGTVWSYADVIAKMAIGTDGNDTLYGDAKANTFDGKGGNDVLTGAGGSDTYLFGRGYGQDTVVDVGYTSDKNTIQFLDGVSPQDVIFSRPGGVSGLDLIISIAGTTDTLTVTNQFKYGPSGYLGTLYGVQLFKFADGTTYTWTDMMNIMTQGTAGNDTIVGDAAANLIDGKGGDDVLYGGGGGDTFVFNIGSGHDVITPGGGTADIEKIKFGPGISLSDLTFTRPTSSSGSLIVTITSTGESVQIMNEFNGKGSGTTGAGIRQFIFDDGTVLSYDDVFALASKGTDGNDTIYGDDRANVLSGGKGNDTINGGAGSDTYLFNLGDGQDRITDAQHLNNETDTNVIKFGAGISASDLTVTRVGTSNDMLVKIAGTTDSITVTNEFLFAHKNSQYYAGVNQFVFADGTVWTYADIERHMTTGGAGNDTLIGDEGDDIIDGGAGNDSLDGGAGTNIYVFGRGYGTDTINETNSFPDAQTSIVQLKDDVSPADVYFFETMDAQGILKMGIKGTNDVLIFRSYHGAWTVKFSDGTVLGYNDIIDSIDKGTDGNDYMSGDTRNNTLHGGLGNDFIVGGAGSDTYLFSRGDGQDTISDSYAAGDINTLKFGPGITLADLTLQRVASTGQAGSALLVTINGTTDSITINGEFMPGSGNPGSVARTGIQQFVFDDGTVLTYADIYAQYMTGTSSTQTLSGTSGDDYYDGKGGNDTYSDQLGGNDTYFVQAGYGKTVISDTGSSADVDVLKLGDGYSGQNLMFSRSASGNSLVLQAIGSDETITVLNQYDTTNKYGVEKIVFADGSTWSAADIKARTFFGDTNSNTLVGTAGNDSLFGGAGGNDSMTGGNGSDTYMWGKTYGQDVIDNTATDGSTATDRVLINGVNNDQLWFTKAGNDLQIAVVGTSDKLTLKNWYTDTTNQVDEFDLSNGMVLDKSKVDTLVTAMSQFSAPTGSSLNLPTNVETALAPTLAATWKSSHSA